MSSFPRRSRSGDDAQIVPRRTIRSAGSQLLVASDATLVVVVVLVPARVRTMTIAFCSLVASCSLLCGADSLAAETCWGGLRSETKVTKHTVRPLEARVASTLDKKNEAT